MPGSEREEGYYWVDQEGVWIIGWWYVFGNCWYLVNSTEMHSDSEFTRIGPRCYNPITEPEQVITQHLASLIISKTFEDMKPEIERLINKTIAKGVKNAK
jgi:hypothetical protein